jgi:predicted ATPase
MYLIACAANGTFARTLADEGGMSSVLWAGRRHKSETQQMRLAVELDELRYELTCGLIPMEPAKDPPGDSLSQWFRLDPDIKHEEIQLKYRGKLTSLLERKAGLVSTRDMDGRRVEFPSAVLPNESILSALREPHRFPDLHQLRSEILSWRFYHHFRTDLDSPLRRPQLGVITPVLSHDGTDVAAALATIKGTGDSAELNKFFSDAFPGASLILTSDAGHMQMQVEMPDLYRPFQAVEISDGTLQYLCLLAALLTPRPPSLMVLNEPETSLHEKLLPALAKLIARAAQHSQVWITTHSIDLVNHLNKLGGVTRINLDKAETGETIIEGSARPESKDDSDD